VPAFLLAGRLLVLGAQREGAFEAAVTQLGRSDLAAPVD
jgi:predicted DsbA family dithiol-disulfide isomerase